MTELTVLKRKRTAKKNIVLKNILPECEALMVKEKNFDIVREAQVLLQALQESINEVRMLDEAVSNLIEDDKGLEKNEQEAYEFMIKARKVESKLREFMTDSGNNNEMMKVNPFRGVGVKLPKIKIKQFSGDATEWKAFIEAFDATVHARTDISYIEKFTYLKGFLTDGALQTIEGLPLTNDNYENAREILQKRYGNPQLIVSSRMNSLLKLPKILHANAKDMRNIYDKVEINIRALNSAGISSEHFGVMLIPIVLEKLPDMVKLQISRKLGSDNWCIADFMNCINDEISARETFEFLKGYESDKSDVGSEPVADKRTTTSLTVQSGRACVFCGDRKHYSDKCDVITDVPLRKEKLKEMRCCYRCLTPNHIASTIVIDVKPRTVTIPLFVKRNLRSRQ